MVRLITTLIVFTIVSGQLLAQSVYSNADGIANNGYDLVSYFTDHEAQRGSNEYATQHQGATYFFTNTEHLTMFKQSPTKYLPQYDGYCSFAVAKMNQKVPVDPTTFRIDDGKLYLFYNDYWEGKPFNTIVPWINNEAEMSRLAEANWPALKSQ